MLHLQWFQKRSNFKTHSDLKQSFDFIARQFSLHSVGAEIQDLHHKTCFLSLYELQVSIGVIIEMFEQNKTATGNITMFN